MIVSKVIYTFPMKMASDDKVSSETVNNENEVNVKKEERDSKQTLQNDNEDADSLEEQPLDIGENYVVKRCDGTWR